MIIIIMIIITTTTATPVRHVEEELNRQKPQAEKIIAEEQAGFKAGRSTKEQIFNLSTPCESYLQQQQNIYLIWILQVLARSLMGNINANLINVIQQLYDRTSGSVDLTTA
ncbi:hypothetical protein RRG08_043572 [Elysia crispata]|uniref:Uncharacterized protein n=1 Tax=Elysia crispata TaxID=231223 RepID=A0AAE1A5Y2_9GAST|nr:hypothetical protein RRG08_043572 [Elysia crispata]